MSTITICTYTQLKRTKESCINRSDLTDFDMLTAWRTNGQLISFAILHQLLSSFNLNLKELDQYCISEYRMQSICYFNCNLIIILIDLYMRCIFKFSINCQLHFEEACVLLLINYSSPHRLCRFFALLCVFHKLIETCKTFISSWTMDIWLGQ